MKNIKYVCIGLIPIAIVLIICYMQKKSNQIIEVGSEVNSVSEYDKESAVEDKTLLEEKEKNKIMKISVKNNGSIVIFELNNSTAAKAFYNQLPMTVEVENYSNNEKIFYPASTLDTSNTPMEKCSTGTLAYFAPWGNIVMFYGDFGKYNGLYNLGNAVESTELIKNLHGTIYIEKIDK